mmetsp:Transcript_2122/g.2301  ORF Transcript_2122/g.2301 Transcript_2122/m.2301 type:complete len:484 (-) Transcript_2122:65-1516(-)
MTDYIGIQQIPTPRTSKPSTPTEIKTSLSLEQLDTQIISATVQDELSIDGTNNLQALKRAVPYKTSMATITFSGTIREKIDAVASAGFDGIEIMTPDLDEITPQELYQYCQSKNLEITVLQPFRDLEGYNDESKFQKKLEELERTFEVMKELHTDLLMCCANCLPESEISLDETTIIQQLAAAADLAAKYNIRIAYENLSWATHIFTLDRLCHIVRKVNRPNFGLCLDTFHINIHDSSLDLIDNMGDKIFFVQYCDAPILKLNTIIEYARNYRVFPGQGEYSNIVEMLAKIYNNGYKGYLSLEVFNASFRENSEYCKPVADDALRGLLYLQAVFCDQYLGKQILPSLRVDYASLNTSITSESTARPFSWSDLTFHMDQSSQESFKHNCETLGYSNYYKTQPLSSDISASMLSPSQSPSISRIILKVNNRLEFNRQCLFIRSVFGMSHIQNDPYNAATDFGLPIVTTFGYTSGGLVITLSLNQE